MDKLVSESSQSNFLPEARLICRVCQKQFSRYTCPRCNTRYCSLECYKRHSLPCNESFMRENVMEELHQIQSSDETKRKMQEILLRVHSEDDKDSDGEDSSILSEETITKFLSVDATLANRVASDADQSLNSADMTVGEKSQPVIQIATPETTVVTEQAGSATLLPVSQVQGATSAVRSNRYIQTFSRKRIVHLPIVDPTGKNQQDSTEEEEVEEEAEEEDDGEDWQVYHSRGKKKPGVTLLFDDTSVTQGNGVALKRLLHGSPRNRARVLRSRS